MNEQYTKTIFNKFQANEANEDHFEILQYYFQDIINR